MEGAISPGKEKLMARSKTKQIAVTILFIWQ
jgi:hypothetical protein